MYDTDEIKNRVDIVEVIGSYVPLKKQGKEYVGKCPFHNDNNPSYFVNRQKKFAHCFGCDAHHDVIEFLMEKEGIDFKTACERLGGDNKWEPVISAPKVPEVPERITEKPPADEPTPDMKVWNLGAPIKIFPFLDLDGSLICYEARYDDPDSKSRMWTWGYRADEKPKWACGHYNVPRPLYGLNRLMTHPPDAKILITEGPKKADAGDRLLGKHYVCLSWSGGSNVWARHNWDDYIAGRDVLLWPDADRQVCKKESDAVKFNCKVGDIIPYEHQKGQKAMYELADYLLTIGCNVRIINVEGMPAKWDIADAEEEGMTTMEVVEWAKPRARDYHPDDPPFSADVPDEQQPAVDPRVKEDKKITPVKPANVPGSEEERFNSLVVVYADQTKIKPIKWLWEGRFAKGKVSMIAGNPGLGKSQITASMASIVSNGGLWPGDRTECERGSVIILSAEDDPEDTIVPRLIAAGADISKVAIVRSVKIPQESQGNVVSIQRNFSIVEDVSRIEALVNRMKDVRMIIVDPLSAYMGMTDTHKDAETRGAMWPLQNLAEERNIAAILVSHLNKNESSGSMMRVQGSIAKVALARAVFGVDVDPDDPARRLFMPIKSNLATDEHGLAFRIESTTVESDEGEISTSRVMWENDLVEKPWNYRIGGSMPDEDHQEMNDACQFLSSLLADGALPQTQIDRDSKGAGFSRSSINRAKKKLGIKPFREGGIGGKGKWSWELPEKRHKKPYEDPYS